MRILSRRATTSYKLPGTTTFRLASAKLLGFYGTNLQNPSESFMRCVIPEDGHVFLQPDQSGAEALIVAYEAPDGRFRQLFKHGIKPHSYMALQIFMDKFRGEHPSPRYAMIEPSTLVTYPEWKGLAKTIKNSQREYDLGKRVIHAKNYNMGPNTLRLNVLEETEGAVVLTHPQSKQFLSTHETAFPEILEYHAIVRAKIYAERTLCNLFGYPRLFARNFNDSLLREAYAFIPQSTVGCITNLCYVEVYHYIKKNKLPWTLLNNKHDSLLLEVPDTTEHIEHAKTVLKRHMERELVSSRGERYQMKSGISIGHNWAKKSKDNPQGMEEL